MKFVKKNVKYDLIIELITTTFFLVWAKVPNLNTPEIKFNYPLIRHTIGQNAKILYGAGSGAFSTDLHST